MTEASSEPGMEPPVAGVVDPPLPTLPTPTVASAPTAAPPGFPPAPPLADGRPNGLLAMNADVPPEMFADLVAVPGLTKKDLDDRVVRWKTRPPNPRP